MDEYDLVPVDRFRFRCYKGIECFNRCCRNLSIALTPYDVLRLRMNLGLNSTEFLRKYTTWHIGQVTGLPVVTFKSGDCPFVTLEGCSVYKDRPTSCRLYPLARVKAGGVEKYYLLREEFCMGHEENVEWDVQQWLRDQGVEKYNEMNDLFYEIIATKLRFGVELDKEDIDRIYTACFDTDNSFFCIRGSMGPEDALRAGMRWTLGYLRGLRSSQD